MTRPDAGQVSDRALALYALTRRAAIEHVISVSGGDKTRVAQAEAARQETDRWLDRQKLRGTLSETEAKLFDAESGSWPAPAVADGMWRKESLGILLWALRHVPAIPPFGEEFEQSVLDARITAYGSEDSFRSSGSLRSDAEIEQAWREADAWFAATEGRTGEDAALASVAAERSRALSWLRDAGAPAA